MTFSRRSTTGRRRQRVAAPALVAAAAGVLVLTACTGGGSEAGSESLSSSTTTSSSGTQAPTPEPYSAEQLRNALPTKVAQFHGMDVSTRCEGPGGDLERCPIAPVRRGGGSVIALGEKEPEDDPAAFVPDSAQMTAFAVLTKQVWTDRVEACPNGRIDVPLKYISRDPDRWTPGQRGTSERRSVSIDGWSGFRCNRDITYLHPKGAGPAAGDSHHVADFVLRRAGQGLTVSAPTLGLAEDLLHEYLARLGS